MFRDYSCILLEDCSAEPQGQINHEASVSILQQLFGWVSSSRQFLEGLGTKEPVPAA
jgi:nicotinamidase-related amidase